MQIGTGQETLNQRLRAAIDADDFAACIEAMLDGANPLAITKMANHNCSLLTLAMQSNRSEPVLRCLIVFCDPTLVPKNCQQRVNEVLQQSLPIKLCNVIFLCLQECQKNLPKFFFKTAAEDNYRRGHRLFTALLQADNDDQLLLDYFNNAACDLADNTCESRILIKLAADPQLANSYQLNLALKPTKKSDRLQTKQNLLSCLQARVPAAVTLTNEEELEHSSHSAIEFDN